MRKMLVGLVFVLATVVASAHVTVSPRESPAGVEQRYTVRVPTEGQVSTTSVELEVPADVTVLDVPAGEAYKHQTRRENGRIVAITWTQEIKPRDVAEFVFLVRNPRSDRITWKAHQRFADGTVTDWVGIGGDRRPASITKSTVGQ
ncbi:MAG TPA: DUF1775 domain-containing protein [Vicinamibacterales bacterium]|nr:DUF1775 domain-containing protein [Vicinamibacterales bacterium]